MVSLVEQLQSETVDASIPVATLLRKVKLIASKLGLSDTLIGQMQNFLATREKLQNTVKLLGKLKPTIPIMDGINLLGIQR